LSEYDVPKVMALVSCLVIAIWK